jgi:hypothetical protein
MQAFGGKLAISFSESGKEEENFVRNAAPGQGY